MSLITLLIAHTFIAGICGIAAGLYIAAYLLSIESVNSPRIGVRYLYRYLIFSFCYMASFMLTPLLVNPFLEHFKFMPDKSDAKGYLYFVLCIPLASLFYYLDYKLILWGDASKIRARKKLQQNLRSRR